MNPCLKPVFNISRSRFNCRSECLRRLRQAFPKSFHPQWGAADVEIKVPSGENTELKRSPFKAWSRSVHSHTCYAYSKGFLPCLFLPARSIHLHFFKTSPDFFQCWLWLTHDSCVGPQNKLGHPAGGSLTC